MPDQTFEDAQRKIEKLTKINEALIGRVERATDQQGNAYSLFTAAITLENQIVNRNGQLKDALFHLEQTNSELVTARDAAEKAHEIKTRFFTAVGHDLLQPLHAARLGLSALDSGAQSDENKRITAQIDHALSSIEELLRTILDISKLATGDIQPNLKPVSLDKVFQDLTLDIGTVVKEKGLKLEVSGAGHVIHSDPLLLRRVLQNLMSNAVRYTEKGQITLEAAAAGDCVEISIQDTGPGISPQEKERIFEEFHRGAAAKKPGSDGLGFGLGLSIVQRMATALKHEVLVDSILGEGSRFTVRARKSHQQPSEKSQPATPAEVRGSYGLEGTKVFVIDNDNVVLDAMRVLLRQWSCDAVFVNTLQDTDAFISNPPFKPDIVLADYHLEKGTSGIGAIAKLRAEWGSDLPAVVITADHSEETGLLIQDAKCEVLRKPVRPGTLRALVSQLVRDYRQTQREPPV